MVDKLAKAIGDDGGVWRKKPSLIGHDAHVEQVGEWVTVEIFKADRHAEAHKRVVVAVLEVDPEREIIKGGDLYVEP